MCEWFRRKWHSHHAAPQLSAPSSSVMNDRALHFCAPYPQLFWMGSLMVPIRGLHHFAYRCRDAGETRRFYEDLLGLPLVHLVRADLVPSTGEHCPYVHIFFRMGDGSHLAFFDLGDDVAAEPSPNTPAWVNHIALKVDTPSDLQTARDKLEAAEVAVLGITDHQFIRSIYFFDPNGIRMELTAFVGDSIYMADKERSARQELDAWTQEKLNRRHGGEVRQG
jgi:glyoxylase I family protein